MYWNIFSVFAREREVTGAGRCLGQRLDHVHQLVTGGDVHSAVLIGQPSVRDTGKHSVISSVWPWKRLQSVKIRRKFIENERNTRTRVHPKRSLLSIKFDMIFSIRKSYKRNVWVSLTHTCVGSGERWPGGRCHGGTRRPGSLRPPRPDWPPAGPSPGTTSPQWGSGHALRWRPRPRPSERCRRGKPAAPSPGPGTDLEDERTAKAET